MPHLLEAYALALDAAAFGNSDRHSDNLEAEVARKAAISHPRESCEHRSVYQISAPSSIRLVRSLT